MAIPKKDLGAQLTQQLKQAYEAERKMWSEYDPNTDSYRMTIPTGYGAALPTGGERVTRDGIESWHARGTERYLAEQLEMRLQKMDAAHKREMTNLANQLISMNNAIEARVAHINGFYTWLIETYPETVAQYKALLDLKRLTDGEEEQ
jgi:hypothetical protein